MQIKRVQISLEREEHIWKHRVTPAEVREAVEQGQVFRGPRSDHGGPTYIVRGRTYSGRRLKVLVRSAGRGIAILITAMDDPDRG